MRFIIGLAAVAQLVEHVIRNDGVGGSSPFSGTSFIQWVADMCLNSLSGDPKRDQRSSIAKAIDSRNPKLLHIMREMYANI